MANPTSASFYAALTFYSLVILLCSAWTAVILRLYVRFFITKNPGWDDGTMLLTLCLFTSYCSFILAIATLKHIPKGESFVQILVFIQLGELFYILTTTLLKISLGLFFLRLLTSPWQVRLFHTILAISALYGSVYFLISLFQCGNPNKLADNLMGSKKCLPKDFQLAAGYIYGVINVLADWTFVLVPICILVESDMERRAKISVGIVMGLGAVGSISSILRMVYLPGLHFSGSITAASVKATLWATAEPGTGIIAASIAVLRPLFRQITFKVRDKLSAAKSTRSGTSTQATSDMYGTIALVLDISPVAPTAKRVLWYSAELDDEDGAWETDVRLERAQIGTVVHMRMRDSGYYDLGPPVPPKP
ncbi:hypothetical protein BDV95DRAFT_604345 [Massariosphaeria phaeospora]|uniref:Rhodopsin domain-containing protein n=1 Tax=Massariosphaeria phaeospora TaxID=100035 RepID=A0A7C8MFK1_9PLEO|nr:hypothetical protein BDV95DRAFT_604345 [Massariosphaeria phaeospora]